MEFIKTDLAPAPVGPYSQAVKQGNFVFCSGQIALHPKTGEMVGKTAAEQAVQVMDNMKAVLEAAGSSLSKITKTTIFLTDLGTFSDVNAVYDKKLGGYKPARSTVEVPKLPKGALVEIECIAIV